MLISNSSTDPSIIDNDNPIFNWKFKLILRNNASLCWVLGFMKLACTCAIEPGSCA